MAPGSLLIRTGSPKLCYLYHTRTKPEPNTPLKLPPGSAGVGSLLRVALFEAFVPFEVFGVPFEEFVPFEATQDRWMAS